MSQNNQQNSQPEPSLQKDFDCSNVGANQQRAQSNQQKVTKQKQTLMCRMKIFARTWTKDSYGLFDYQAGDDNYIQYTEFLEDSAYIVRDNRCNFFINILVCKTMLVKDLKEIKQKQEKYEHMSLHYNCLSGKQSLTIIGQLVVDRQRKAPSFKLKPYKKPSQQEQNKKNRPENKHSQYSKKFVPFVYAEGTQPKSNGLLLSPGSIIKFGRVEYLVLESFNGKQTKSYCNSIYYEDEENNVFDVMKKKALAPEVCQVQDKDNMNCKICLCNEQTIEDPLISPCNCKGYCGLIHVNCLRTWINNKVKKDTVGLAISYNFTKFECQICKAPFPKIIRTQNDAEVEMMKIEKPEKPYIMLQSLDPTGSYANPHPNQTSTEKETLLHVISTDEKNPIKVGRANECQIRLMDISVSRKHAEIKLVDGNFYIRDTGAKFGTLVQLIGLGNNNKQDIIINKKKPLKIQLGRTSYELTVQDINEDIDTQ